MPLHNTLVRAGALAGSLLFCFRPLAAQTAVDSLLTAERAVSDASGRGTFAIAIVAALAGDGAILWPGAPVIHGVEPVRRLLAAQRLLDSLRVTWQPLSVEMAADASLGVTWGVTAVARDGGPARIGRYIAAWQREAGGWKLAAFVGLVGSYPAAASTVTADKGPVTLPPLVPSGPAAAFIAADLAFARLAGDSTAALAFERFAAPQAVFGSGLQIKGPAAIRSALEGGPPSAWTWHPVLAGAAGTRDLGFTVGESVIRVEGSPTSYGKYLTIWRRLPDGSVRFLTDGGSPRPATP